MSQKISWKHTLLIFILFVFMISGYDLIRHSILYETNTDVLNKLINGVNPTSPEIMEHFKNLAFFKKGQAVLFFLLPFLGIAISKAHINERNIFTLFIICSFALIIGKSIALVLPIDFKTIQYFIVSYISFVIVIYIIKLLAPKIKNNL